MAEQQAVNTPVLVVFAEKGKYVAVLSDMDRGGPLPPPETNTTNTETSQ